MTSVIQAMARSSEPNKLSRTLRRPSEKLDEHVARQLPAAEFSRVALNAFELPRVVHGLMEAPRLLGQQHEMDEQHRPGRR